MPWAQSRVENLEVMAQTVVNAPNEKIPCPQLIENDGRLVGTRTPDLYRVKVAL